MSQLLQLYDKIEKQYAPPNTISLDIDELLYHRIWNLMLEFEDDMTENLSDIEEV